MTCEEFRRLSDSRSDQLTRATIAAGVMHYRSCAACKEWDKGQLAGTVLSGDEKRQLVDHCEQIVAEISNDPECDMLMIDVETFLFGMQESLLRLIQTVVLFRQSGLLLAPSELRKLYMPIALRVQAVWNPLNGKKYEPAPGREALAASLRIMLEELEKPIT